MDYKDLAAQLAKRCFKKGADAAEIYIETNRNLTIEVRKGDVESIEEAYANGLGIRVIVKGKLAFSSCNQFTDKALDDMITHAIEFAKSVSADPYNIFPSDKGITPVEGLFDPGITAVGMDQKIDLLKKLEKLAMKDPRITKSAGARYSENEQEIFIANTNGINKNAKSSFCFYAVTVVAEKGDEQYSGSDVCYRRFYSDLQPPEEIAEKAAQNAYNMLGARHVKTQKAAVIFDPDVAYAFLGGILGAVNGESVLQGASFLGKKMNKQIGSELLTIIDDATVPKGIMSAPFDSEGVPTQKRTIIEKGILKGFMYNTIVAHRSSVKNTGNAGRGDYRGMPEIVPHAFYVAAGSSTPNEIVKATKSGLYLKDATGSGINPVNGNFSCGAAGFWIENGAIAYPVKELTIAGNADEMLKGIDMVANDLDLSKSFTSPTFRIKSFQVGGD